MLSLLHFHFSIFFHLNLMHLLTQDHLPLPSQLPPNYTTKRHSKAAAGLMAALLL